MHTYDNMHAQKTSVKSLSFYPGLSHKLSASQLLKEWSSNQPNRERCVVLSVHVDVQVYICFCLLCTSSSIWETPVFCFSFGCLCFWCYIHESNAKTKVKFYLDLRGNLAPNWRPAENTTHGATLFFSIISTYFKFPNNTEPCCIIFRFASFY